MSAPVLHSPEATVVEIVSTSDPAFASTCVKADEPTPEARAYSAGDLQRWRQWTPAGVPLVVTVRPLTAAEEDRVGVSARAYASASREAADGSPDAWRVAWAYWRALEAFRLCALEAKRDKQVYDKAAMMRWPLELRRELGSLVLTLTEVSDPFGAG